MLKLVNGLLGAVCFVILTSDVLAATHECLLCQIVASFLDGQHRPMLPLFSFAQLLRCLILQSLLIGDRGRNLLLGLNQLRAHVDNDLIKHLLRLFCRRDQIIDIGSEETSESVENAHF